MRHYLCSLRIRGAPVAGRTARPYGPVPTWCRLPRHATYHAIEEHAPHGNSRQSDFYSCSCRNTLQLSRHSLSLNTDTQSSASHRRRPQHPPPLRRALRGLWIRPMFWRRWVSTEKQRPVRCDCPSDGALRSGKSSAR